MTTDTLLQQGIVAARAGQREEARTLLMQVVEADERNEEAWLWLAGVVDDPEDMRTCLQNVLDLNPANQKAQQGLAWLESRYGPPSTPEPAQPQVLSPATEATIRLADEVAPSTPAPQPAAPPAIVAPPTPQPPDEAAAPVSNPCPYCGASTILSQKSCPKCHNSLMMRAASNEKRSVATTILAVLWGIGGILSLIGSLIILGVGIYIGTASGRGFLRRLNLPGALPSTYIILIGIVALVISVLYVAIARGLFRRARWAYYLHVFFTLLSVLGTVASVVLAGAIAATLPTNRAQALNADSQSSVSLFCNIIVLILYIALTILSFRDFFGRRMRFQPEVDTADHMGHFNIGLAYKNRGMWYMAMREWEAAVSQSPKDVDYLHALGLAYAQVKEFAKARTTLDTALSLAPTNPRIQDSRALVDRLMAKQR